MRHARPPVVLVSKLCASRLVRDILKSVAVARNFEIGTRSKSRQIGATSCSGGRASRRVKPVRVETKTLVNSTSQ